MTDLKDSPILITGCARSGTSIVAGTVKFSGAFGGKLTGATPYNQKGMFENGTIRNTIVKPYLISIKADPLGQKPLPDMEILYSVTKRQATEWRHKILDVMEKQGYEGGQWFYKGAKMCLMWPLWHFAFPNARWIIVRRQSEDIVKSCLRTAFMKKYNGVVGWMTWVDFHKERFIEMLLSGLDVSIVWPQEMINGNLDEIKFVIKKLGLNFNEEVVKDFIEPRLWRKGNG